MAKAQPHPAEVIQQFIECINDGDLEGITALLTDDHIFVDALGESVSGAKPMRNAWAGYLECFPDYEINVESVVEAGATIGVFGTCSGTYVGPNGSTNAMAMVSPDPDRSWQIPAAWLAVVRGGRIAEWRVYCDTQAMAASMTETQQDDDDENEGEIDFEFEGDI